MSTTTHLHDLYGADELPSFVLVVAKAMDGAAGDPFWEMPNHEQLGITDAELTSAQTFLKRVSRRGADRATELSKLVGVPMHRRVEPSVSVVTEPASWHWLSTKGLQSAKQWTLSLASCKKVTPMAKVLGAAIREYVHVKSGTVYVGIQTLEAALGWYRRDIESRRNELRNAGWLVDTGDRQGRAIVFRLDIPACDCARHRPE